MDSMLVVNVRKLPTFAPGLERSRKTEDRDILVESFRNVVANYSFNERMTGWRVGYAFDFFILQEYADWLAIGGNEITDRSRISIVVEVPCWKWRN
jgi:hypothetical protein